MLKEFYRVLKNADVKIYSKKEILSIVRKAGFINIDFKFTDSNGYIIAAKKQQMKIDRLLEIAKYSYNNKNLLMKENICGCFYCFNIFNPKLIKEWIDDGTTAICPYCSIDSVIPKYYSYELNKELLEEIGKYFFFSNW